MGVDAGHPVLLLAVPAAAVLHYYLLLRASGRRGVQVVGARDVIAGLGTAPAAAGGGALKAPWSPAGTSPRSWASTAGRGR